MSQAQYDSLRCPSNPTAAPSYRMLPSASTGSFSFPHSSTLQNTSSRAHHRSTRTWTASSAERGLLNDNDEVESRTAFVQEYNRLAKKHGVRILVVDNFSLKKSVTGSASPQKRGWLYRILRSASGQHSITLSTSPSHQVRHKRSVSDLAHQLVHQRREPIKSLDMTSMVRLSGKSVLYLPPEHAPSALILPTCIRATAHYLAQHSATRGIFRIPGSARTVSSLFDYYCHTDKGGNGISGTVRCANLPGHIQVSVHDVASTFKRLLSVLPGGILGSIAIFDALVAIHSQLHGDPEFPRTKQTRVRARLIALAIASIESQFRREAVCAVFGLLSLIGRIAEIAPREDHGGRPLPTGDLMGYSALGIVFGPLLLGDTLDDYSTKLAIPDSGLISPLSSHKDRRVCRGSKTAGPPIVNKILVANSIAEMMISNWRDIVRQMKSIGMQRANDPPSLSSLRTSSLQQSTSETFVIRKPRDWDQGKEAKNQRGREYKGDEVSRDRSPEPDTPTLSMRRQRPAKRKTSSTRLGHRPSFSILSPTAEESGVEDGQPGPRQGLNHAQMELADISRHIRHNRSKINVSRPIQSRPATPKRCWKYGSRNSSLSRQLQPPGKDKKQRDAIARKGAIKAREAQRNSPKTDRTMATDRKSSRSNEIQMPLPSRAFSFTDQQNEEVSGLTVMSEPTNIVSKTPLHAPAGNLADSYSDTSPGPSSDLSGYRHQRRLRAESAGYSNGPVKGPRATGPGRLDEHDEIMLHGDSCRRKTTHGPGPCLENQLEVGPREFYAAMRLPPHLSGHHGHWPPASSNIALQVGQFDTFPAGVSQLQRKAAEMVRIWDSVPTPQERSPIRESVAEVASKQGSVRAMAAMFEDPEAQKASKSAKPQSRTQSLISHYSQASAGSPVKSIRSSRSGSNWTQSPNKASIIWNQSPSRNPSGAITQRISSAVDQKLSSAICENLALRAESIKDLGNTDQLAGSEKAHMMNLRYSVPPRKPLPPQSHKSKDALLQTPPSLGTMIPYPDQPPVAQHLNLLRPSSSASDLRRVAQPDPNGSGTSTPRPGSATVLHAQIRTLQRQLYLKMEEAAQLRKQLEVHENTEVGTLSQQLREAKREAQMWKERAEAAERRIKVFERFTARLRGIKDAVTAEGHDSKSSTPGSDRLSHQDRPAATTRDKTASRRSDQSHRSESSRRTEDAGVITARIRRCLHGGREDGPADSPPSYAQDLFGKEDFFGCENVGGSQDLSESAVEFWMAAQELLKLERSG
ncbi:hypothetical protein BGZ63DRAFT_355791 [Mariannaea sp. PMI_226]|nr:hypothetical protein BGZ63DRAFT_355791 [Mariannaea sp. PMI_226]